MVGAGARLELPCLSTQASEVEDVFAGQLRPTPLQRGNQTFARFQNRPKPAIFVPKKGAAGVKQSVELSPFLAPACLRTGSGLVWYGGGVPFPPGA